MKAVSVKIEFKVSDDISDLDIVEWVEFNLGANGSMAMTNAMEDMEANDICGDLKGDLRMSIDGKQII